MVKADYGDLIEQLHDRNRCARHRAQLELIQAGEDVVPLLEQAISSGDLYLSWWAAKTLSQMCVPAVIPILIDMLRKNEDAGIRWIAAEGLINMGREGLAPLLETLMAHSDSVWLRGGAHHVLCTLYKRGIDSRAIESTLRALDSIEPAIDVPWAAKDTLDHLM
jgi:hypothetical protein